MRQRPLAKSPLRSAALLAGALLFLGLGAATLPGRALAGGQGGRIHNPKRLRVKKESVAPGRRMRRPSVTVRRGRPLRRSFAVIPNPEPRRRGGSGFIRRGRYFYELPRPITANRRSWTHHSYRPVIPDPTSPRRRVRSRVR